MISSCMVKWFIKYSFHIFTAILAIFLVSIIYLQGYMYFFDKIFSGYTTLISAWAIIAVYLLQKKDSKSSAAQVLLMEIRNAEQTLDRIKLNILDLTDSILPVNSWSKFQHLFTNDLDRDEFSLISNFYNMCHIIERQKFRINETFEKNIDEKAASAQHKLTDLMYECAKDKKDEVYYNEIKQIFIDSLNKEIFTFSANAPNDIIIKLLNNLPRITTSSCGVKLKSIANIK